MLKDEVLARSRSEKADEGIVAAENSGRKIGFLAFIIIFIFLIFFNLFLGDFPTVYAISALFWAFMAAEAYAKYRFTKKMVYFVSAFAGGMASLASLVNHILYALE